MKKIRQIKLIIIILITVFIFLLFSLSACSLTALFDNASIKGSSYLDMSGINLDENELKSLEITNQTIEEKIDTPSKISFSSSEIRDPFLPFFMSQDSENEDQKNMLTVEKIYSENNIFFVEIDLNDAVYKLKAEDLFGKIYQVKAINADSVVLLKGEEIITLFINEIYYD